MIENQAFKTSKVVPFDIYDTRIQTRTVLALLVFFRKRDVSSSPLRISLTAQACIDHPSQRIFAPGCVKRKLRGVLIRRLVTAMVISVPARILIFQHRGPLDESRDSEGVLTMMQLYQWRARGSVYLTSFCNDEWWSLGSS